MRSKLFVPGSRPELFPKAMASEADALSFDLEDAVSQPRKAEARQHLQTFLTEVSSSGTPVAKTLIVRVNDLESGHFQADIDAIVRPGLHMVNVPKVEDPETVRYAAQCVIDAARSNGLAQPPLLLLNIETPKSLRLAADLARAHPQVAGLQLGLGDLFEPYGIYRRELSAIQQVLFAVRMAAAEVGVFAYDGAFADIRDADGYRAEAALSRRYGFIGKSCIHPSQVALANSVYQPTQDEIAHAQRVVAAAQEADANAVGAFTVDGKMVDRPFILRAQSILQAAKAAGLVSS